jgi:hypothetical protein
MLQVTLVIYIPIWWNETEALDLIVCIPSYVE